MITYTVFLVGMGVLLFFFRRKIAWGSLVIGLFVMCLLLATPVGGPLNGAAHGIEAAIAQAGNGILHGFGVGR